MSEPCLTQIASQALKIRWISVQCYEIALPNGKVIVTDPFYLDASRYDGMPELTKSRKMERNVYPQTGFSVDEFTGADYIILNRVHGDHSNLVGGVNRRSQNRVKSASGCCTHLLSVIE